MSARRPIEIGAWFLKFPFSPTRAIARILIRFGIIRGYYTIIAWNTLFYAFSAWIFCKVGIGTDASTSDEWFSYLVIAITVARTNELVMAFYGDAIGRIKNNGSDLESQLKISDERRIYLLTFAYAEIIVNFGTTYYFLQRLYTNPLFEKPISSIWDTLYFSGITVTTTGFGDFSPKAIVSNSIEH